ncbi:MAG: ABC transporter ATP-binding protein [Planctomycetota bacterium]
MSSKVEWQAVSKRYGAHTVLDEVSLVAEPGELLCLLGPSGCGKTTLLRMLAGFIAPDRGRVLLDGRDITDLPPYRRQTAMVFQSYALWPHMTVFDNVAYGLVEAGVPKAERHERVMQMLAMVRLENLALRKPLSLSGGQQQRVALARALVVNPAVVLLDEPLSNLDLVLRIELRRVIRELQERLKLTMVYVTHDRVEALELSHHIAVLEGGRVQQFGRARELYRRPANAFVAGFLGDTNLIAGVARETDSDLMLIETPAGRLRADLPGSSWALNANLGDRADLSVRPEAFRRLADDEQPRVGENLLTGTLQTVFDRGETCLCVLAGIVQPSIANEDAAPAASDQSPPPAPAIWRVLLLNPPDLPAGTLLRFAVHQRDVVVMPPGAAGSPAASATSATATAGATGVPGGAR